MGALILCGCGAPDEPAVPVATSTRSSASTSASGPVPTATTSPSVLATASDPLTAAVYALAEQSRSMRGDTTMSTSRNALNDGVAAARAGLKRTRTAAYGTAGRNCQEVESNARATRAGAVVAQGAYEAIQPILATQQSRVTGLAAAVEQVQALAMDREGGTPADLEPAIASAQEQVRLGQADVDATRVGADDGRTKSAEMAASAEDILSKTC